MRKKTKLKPGEIGSQLEMEQNYTVEDISVKLNGAGMALAGMFIVMFVIFIFFFLNVFMFLFVYVVLPVVMVFIVGFIIYAAVTR